MSGLAYYNEHDPFASAWLEALIARGAIAPGDVDTRSIEDVTPDDLRGYAQCHFFAGIGGWSLALRRAGWADDRPVWTGSCPCQPFSATGTGGGFDDERHLWPALHHLARLRRPPVFLGEQVASKGGLEWFDLVSADLEAEGYAVGAADLCAAGFGVGWAEGQGGDWLRQAIRDCDDPWLAAELCDLAAWADAALVDAGPHVRQRLYFVATQAVEHAPGDRRQEWRSEPGRRVALGGRGAPIRIRDSGRLETGSPAATPVGGPLSPDHSRWLMGYPTEWAFCAAMATRSTSRPRRPSSTR